MPKEAAFSRGYEVLDYLGVDEVRHRAVAGYSVGQKQKIKLAQALVHGPRLLFLDEPLSGLDPTSRDEMMSLVAGVARGGVTLVVSSHVLHDVETLCESVLMLDRGKLVYDGPIATLSAAREGLYRIRVRGDAAAFRRALAERGVAAEEGPAGLHAALGDSTRIAWDAARAAGCQIRELEPVRDTLEQAFLRLIGSGA